MDLELLQEEHDFHRGDDVLVYERKHHGVYYSGKIYDIVSLPLPLSEYIDEYKNILVDYFYVTFEKPIYSIFLKRGFDVIYKSKRAILGDVILDKNSQIEKIYQQYRFQSREDEINLDDINAMLVWRVGYGIVKNS